GLTGRGDQSSFESNGIQGGVVNNLPSADPSITPDTNSAVATFHGAWDTKTSCSGASTPTEFAVVLRGHGDASLWITAQKDAEQNMLCVKALSPGTINVPASAPGLLAVGCTVNRIEWKPLGDPPVVLGALGMDMNPVADSACYFSSSGPTPFGVE